LPSTCAASRNAEISACAVGSRALIGELTPRPMIVPVVDHDRAHRDLAALAGNSSE
jgi:hypothetical protein